MPPKIASGKLTVRPWSSGLVQTSETIKNWWIFQGQQVNLPEGRLDWKHGTKRLFSRLEIDGTTWQLCELFPSIFMEVWE